MVITPFINGSRSSEASLSMIVLQQKWNNIKDHPDQATEFANWSFLGKDWITAAGGVSARFRSALFLLSSDFRRWTFSRRLSKAACWSRTRCWAAAWFLKASRSSRIRWISAGDRKSAERPNTCRYPNICASSARLMRFKSCAAEPLAASRNLNRFEAKKQPSRFYVWRKSFLVKFGVF